MASRSVEQRGPGLGGQAGGQSVGSSAVKCLSVYLFMHLVRHSTLRLHFSRTSRMDFSVLIVRSRQLLRSWALGHLLANQRSSVVSCPGQVPVPGQISACHCCLSSNFQTTFARSCPRPNEACSLCLPPSLNLNLKPELNLLLKSNLSKASASAAANSTSNDFHANELPPTGRR